MGKVWKPVKNGTYAGVATYGEGVTHEDSSVVVHGKTLEVMQYAYGHTREAVAQFENLRLCELVEETNGEWEPVDFIRLADGLEVQVDEIAMTIGKGDKALATHKWPEDDYEYAVCRRTVSPKIVYSHRNGEKTPPRQEGIFLFQGDFFHDSTWERGVETAVEVSLWGNFWFADDDPIGRFSGKWWGPIPLPWKKGK